MKVAIAKPRVVLDTNIYLSGLLFGGKPAEIISKGILGDFQIVISQPILLELGEKLLEKFFWPENKVKEVIDSLLEFCEVIDVKGDLRVIKEDPKDNPILETAIKGKASYLITGDKHTLKLKTYKKVKIIKASKFLKALDKRL